MVKSPKPLKKIALTFQINGVSYDNEFFIMENDTSYQMILGCSFFEGHGAMMNFTKHQLIIPGKKPVDTHSQKQVSTVEANDVVAPFMIMQVEAYRETVPLYCSEDMVVDPY